VLSKLSTVCWFTLRLLAAMKIERLINCIVVDHEDQLSSVLVLLESLPNTPVFDSARQVCQRLRSVNGSPTLRQVGSLVSRVYFAF